MRSLKAGRTYWVAYNPVMDFILGTSSMDRYVCPIIPRTSRIFLQRGLEVALIGRGGKGDRQPSNEEELMREEASNKIRFAQAINIPLQAQAGALVRKEAVVLGLLQNHPRTVLRDVTPMANGITEVKYNTPL